MRKVLLMLALATLIIMAMFVSGCGTTIKHISVREPVGPLPKPPKVVVMDNGKYDKSKFPDTDWVKAPEVDLKKRRASWDFDDIEKISQALTRWPYWGQEVERIVELHDKSASTQQGNASIDKTRKSWFRFWE